MQKTFQALEKALQSWGKKQSPMPPQKSTDELHQEQSEPVAVSITPTVPGVDTLEPWTDAVSNRHNVRVICDQEGLSVQQKNDLSATLHCESNYNPACIHPNIVEGRVTSTDYGICQVNDYYHIGPGKDFPSAQYVLDNPEACVRWMCRQWKAGNGRLWVCYSKSMYKEYSA